ncbi:hypothetical protein ACFFRR_005958 [Megaselia abdita]
MVFFWIFLLLLVLCCDVDCITIVHDIKIKDIEVPEIVDFRDHITLSCTYDISNHTLNSVKWYKDEKELFRYSPLTYPPYMKFPVDGIEIADNAYTCNQTMCKIQFGQLRINSTGDFRCEASGDAPHFKVASKVAHMTVAALPQSDPLIYSFSSAYKFDDFVVANCSSDWSSPPAKLTWYINNQEAPLEILQPLQETQIYAHGYNLISRALEIRFYLNDHRFINARDKLDVKCVAELEEHERFRKEIVYSASISYTDNTLNHQMLINSGLIMKISQALMVAALHVLVFWR